MGHHFMKTRLIVSDIDGTLLRKDGSLSEATRRTLEYVAGLGIPVALATGRTEMTMADVLKELPMVRFVIRSNGAVVWDLQKGRLVFEAQIPHALFEQILDILCGEDVCWHCFADGRGYIDRVLGQKLIRFFERNTPIKKNFGHSILHIEDARDYILNQVEQAEKFGIITGKEETRQRIWEKLEEIPELYVSSASPYNLEINHRDATKGRAAIALAEHLGIHQTDILAFGDNLNDCSLFQVAGTSVAMKNATPELIDFSTEQTYTNDEDGVARYLAAAFHFAI